MNEGNSIMLLLFLTTVLAFGVNAQYSLDEMIQQAKHDQGFVFDTQTARPPPLPPAQSIPVYSPQYPPVGAISLDSRFDSRISNVISNKILELAHSVGVQIRDQQVKSNIISPVSIAGALSLVLLGANGQTFDEVMQLFGFDREPALRMNPYKIHEEFGLLIEDLLSDYQSPMRTRPQTQWKSMSRGDQRRQSALNFTTPSDYHKVTVANGIFLQNGFSLRPSYEAAVLNIYRSEITSLDFRSDAEMSKEYINNWVSHKTHGKIKQIVGAEINSATNMIIASALYFKALWETTFIEGGTNTKNFYPDGLGNTPVPVEMMANGGVFPFYDAKEYDCRILGFPYKGNLTTMYIILPNNSTRHRLREIQTFLTADKIEDMISKMQLKTAVILFPKLHIENSVDLKSVFRKMGLNSLFEPSLSDLSLVSSGRVINFKRPVAPVQGLVQSGSQSFSGNRMDISESIPFIGSTNQGLNNQQVPNYQQAPNNQQVPNYQQAPSNQQAPNYQPVPSNQQVPNYQQAPSNQQVPNYQQAQSNQQVPNYQQAPSNQQAQNYQQAPSNQQALNTQQSTSNLENQLIFSRFGSDDSAAQGMQSDQAVQPNYTPYRTPYNVTDSQRRFKRAVTYKVESSFRKDSPPLRYKDFVLSKRITKQSADKKLLRGRRQADPSDSIKSLDALRNTPGLRNPNIFADAIVHKIDLTINEKGTEGGAATAVYLTRTGTDVVFRVETPFLLLIRHDATKLPLFYGSIFEPTTDN